jgi:hypothetical protein
LVSAHIISGDAYISNMLPFRHWGVQVRRMDREACAH